MEKRRNRGGGANIRSYGGERKVKEGEEVYNGYGRDEVISEEGGVFWSKKREW